MDKKLCDTINVTWATFEESDPEISTERLMELTASHCNVDHATVAEALAQAQEEQFGPQVLVAEQDIKNIIKQVEDLSTAIPEGTNERLVVGAICTAIKHNLEQLIK